MRTDTETDGQTDLTKLILAFHNFAYAPKNPSMITYIYIYIYVYIKQAALQLIAGGSPLQLQQRH